MTSRALGGVVFDAAAVVAFANRANYAQAVVWATVEAGSTIVVPSTVLAAARTHIPADRLDILAVLVGLPHTVVPTFDRTGPPLPAFGDDILAAAGHVTREAVARTWPCLTSRPRRLRQIDPRVIIDPLP
ncbi:hypothetical protein [Nocardia implantans]|uniref:PIN domain-containing protein n=1 Tax=Nocardia implantans TaxID=3108168 RepID=A0ABU6AXE6_9NOCA|nr:MULTISPECIES: hypothetical protein [unclassified Nocardia]MBF6193814.1 hypothetical protein [Nocardia beijingensis]MEA3529450.1 hypothetical protein [Nocardia sp. CDC192]MEB3512036.1 hypothetical protein [Nocardia sp. CDC186]